MYIIKGMHECVRMDPLEINWTKSTWSKEFFTERYVKVSFGPPVNVQSMEGLNCGTNIYLGNYDHFQRCIEASQRKVFVSCQVYKMGYSMKELHISDTPCMDYCHLVGFCGISWQLNLLLAPLTANCVNGPAYVLSVPQTGWPDRKWVEYPILISHVTPSNHIHLISHSISYYVYIYIFLYIHICVLWCTTTFNHHPPPPKQKSPTPLDVCPTCVSRWAWDPNCHLHLGWKKSPFRRFTGRFWGRIKVDATLQ